MYNAVNARTREIFTNYRITFESVIFVPNDISEKNVDYHIFGASK